MPWWYLGLGVTRGHPMAIRDAQNQFCDAQAFDADAYGTNVIDLKAAGILGNGEPMCVELVVDVAADHTTGNEVFSFEVHTDDNAAMSSATVIQLKTILYSALTAGSRHIIPLDLTATEQFLAFYHNGGGTTPTVTLTVFLVPQNQAGKWKAFPDGFNIN